jgi:WD40 repeat protein
VGGGLYRHLLERLAELARDPSPRVAVTAQRALLATGLDPNHALLRSAVGREALRAVDGTVPGSGSGGGAGGSGARDADARESAYGSRSDVFAEGDFPGDAREPFRRDFSDAPRAGASPFGHGGRSPSWHQKLSAAAARLLGSPGRKSDSSRGSAESVSSLGNDPRATESISVSNVDMRRSSSARRLASPLSGRDANAAMKRVATAHAPLRHMSSSDGSERVRVAGSSAETSLSFQNGAARSPNAPSEETRAADGPAVGSVSPRASFVADASAEAHDASSLETARRRRAALPASQAFARSREHFGRSLLEPPAGAQGHDGGYDDDDELFGVGADAPKHRRLDPEKRLARRRVAEERATRSARARRDQLKFLNPRVSSLETFANGATPSCVALHPLTPTATVCDTRGKVHTWDYETGRKLHAFDAGLPGRFVASAGLINDLDDAVLFTASADGCVRVWRDYACPGQESLVAALRALPQPSLGAGSAAFETSAPTRFTFNGARNAGNAGNVGSYGSSHAHRPRSRAAVVWQQESGCLYASGDTRPVPLLRVWDMTRELCLESLQTQSPGTCLVAEGALLMAGALDGAVMSFDLRTPARLLSVVQTHRAPAVAILLQPGNVGNLVVTGAADGEMKFCDLRNAAKPFHTADAFGFPHSADGSIEGAQHEGRRGKTPRKPSNKLPTPDAHVARRARPRASHRERVDGQKPPRSSCGTWRATCFGSPALGSKNSLASKKVSGFGAPRCMAFHPNLVALAAGGADGVATVWQSENGGSRASRYEP